MPLISELSTLPYHNIDPEIFRWKFIVIRWYSVAYIAGLFYVWWGLGKLADAKDAPMTRLHTEDYLVWATLGIILGGRLGYVLFYNFGFYLDNPSQILILWEGGMSFHGGFLGVIVASIMFVRRNGISFLRFADQMALVSPVGIGLVRVANFINGELWGKPSTLPWAMPFPSGGAEPRHPSQLYEAMLEGVLLFIILRWLYTKTEARKYPGLLAGVFTLGYGLSRYVVEFVRVPDAHLGKLYEVISMGQLLSLPMIIIGAYVVKRALDNGPQKLQKKRD